MNRSFTGVHMLAIIIAFFGVVITVNFVMALSAIHSFGGTVVDNSYVASQSFNRWLQEAQQEAQSGWRVSAQREAGFVVVTLSNRTGLVQTAAMTGTAEHPLGRLPNISLHFQSLGEGRFRVLEKLPEGRWRLRMKAMTSQGHAHILVDVDA
jgi:nitrogen fixation protein FixH